MKKEQIKKMRIVILYIPVITIVLFFSNVEVITNRKIIAQQKQGGIYTKTIEDITELIEDEMDDEDIVGLSIALVDDQTLVWAKGFGWADKESNVLATPKTVYRLGSMSELFTSPAIMLLVEKNHVNIDEPLIKYLPEFSINTRFPSAPAIKIRNLISHHSGIQSEILKGEYNPSPERFTKTLELIKDEYLCFPPELLFSFSKVGLSLLGVLVEKATKTTFEDFIEKNIFIPAGMTDSSFSLTVPIKGKLSKGYRDEKEEEFRPLRDVPAEGLYSNVIDLSRYIMIHFNSGKSSDKTVFKPETIDRMLSPFEPDIPLDLDLKVGCGWVFSCLGENLGFAGKVAWHDGVFGPYRGRLIMLLEYKLGVIVLTNTGSSFRSVQTIAVEAIKSALEEKKGIKQPEWEEPDLDDSLPESVLKSYEGDYATPAGFVNITRKGDDLYGEVMGRSILLKPNKNGNFSGRILLFGLIRLKVGPLSNLEFSFNNIQGRNIIALHRYGERFLVGEKVKPYKLTPAWLKRLGTYQVTNAGNDIRPIKSVKLTAEYGKLLAYKNYKDGEEDGQRVALAPVQDDEAIILGLGRYTGDTIKVIKLGNDEFLKYSGYIFKKEKTGRDN